jgi:hypothetical protein
MMLFAMGIDYWNNNPSSLEQRVTLRRRVTLCNTRETFILLGRLIFVRPVSELLSYNGTDAKKYPKTKE